MSKYVCPNCNKDFKQKINFINHTEKKKVPCRVISNFLNSPNCSEIAPNCSKNILIAPNCSKIAPIIQNTSNTSNVMNIVDSSHVKNVNIMDIVDSLIKKNDNNIINNNIDNNKIISCTYCDKTFTRNTNLQRHLNNRCKSKGNYDELEKLKKDMKIIIDNYQKTEKENMNLKNKIVEIETTQKEGNVSNESKIINNINNISNVSNNQINKGVIVNNIQLVQFGNEDIDKLNLVDAMKSYLKSTGGNIASTMLKYINLNKQYPENNNICMTDLSREIVKIHNGEKFVYKKFKNVKDEILTKIVKNTRKIVNNYEASETLKKSADTKNKIIINNVSLKLIDGMSAEDIVRDEINDKEQQLIKNKNIKNNVIHDINSESEEEREFTFEERLRIEHLENKKEGMQKKTFENIKDELYNARSLLI